MTEYLFGLRLREARLRAGLSQADLCRQSGLSTWTVGRLEANPETFPRLDTIFALAKALRISVAQLIGEGK